MYAQNIGNSIIWPGTTYQKLESIRWPKAINMHHLRVVITSLPK